MQNDNALHTAIRQSQEIPNITDAGGNLFCSLKKSTARDDFDLLTCELLDIDISRVGKNQKGLLLPAQEN